MKLLETLTHLAHTPAPKTPAPKAEPTLLQCGGQAIRDLFVPGRQGEKDRIHSQYQLCKKLGVHQALGQSYSQDILSQSGRAVHQVGSTVSRGVHRVSAGTQDALTVAGDFYRDEAKTAKGAYRALIGAGQGAQITAQGLFSTAKGISKMGLASARFTYHGLKGEVDFGALLRKGAEKGLCGAAKGALYIASGRLPEDAKKFAKDCSDYSAVYARKVKNDPGLEVPKLLAIVGCTAALGGGGCKLFQAASKGGEVLAATQEAVALEEAAVASQAAPAVAAEEAVATAAVEETAAQGTIVPPGFDQYRRAAGALSESTGTVYPQGWAQREAAGSFQRTARLPETCAPTVAPPAAPVAAPAPIEPLAPIEPVAPVAPAPVELGPSTLPLQTKTPYCLPSQNYAPIRRAFLEMSEPIESLLDIKG